MLVPLHGLLHGAAHDYHLPVHLHQHGQVGAAPLRHGGRPRVHRDDERRAGHRLDRRPHPYTQVDAERWVRRIAPAERSQGNGIVFAVTEFLTQRLVGSVRLLNTDRRTLATEVRYITAPWARGEGYATESVLALAEWLFRDQGFERIELRTPAGNTASQQVAQKLGCISEESCATPA